MASQPGTGVFKLDTDELETELRPHRQSTYADLPDWAFALLVQHVRKQDSL